jgi:hypothetical protein
MPGKLIDYYTGATASVMTSSSVQRLNLRIGVPTLCCGNWHWKED